MDNIKHVGRMKSNQRKVVVVFRTLPGESDAALVVSTENLTDGEHNSLIKLVESPAGQNAYEFGEVMARAVFPDGSVMLPALHNAGKLVKVKTSDVEMMPNKHTTIGLDQINQMIAEQKGVSVNDLALGNNTKIETIAEVNDISNTVDPNVMAESQVANVEAPLSNDDLAKRMRSDADRLYKEAARLRAEAEVISPTKKKAKETVE
jgi:hypothetical protein